MTTKGEIIIPEGFFPPAGVQFETMEQRDIGCALHRAGIVKLQCGFSGVWRSDEPFTYAAMPCFYRLAPPKPRTVGPFESEDDIATDDTVSVFYTAFGRAWDAAKKAGFKRIRIKCTATAEEIL